MRRKKDREKIQDKDEKIRDGKVKEKKHLEEG